MYDVLIIGAGGHAKVIADIVIKSGDNVVGFLDDNVNIGTDILGYRILGKVELCQTIANEHRGLKFIIGIGSNTIRRLISEKYDLKYYTAIHPSSIIGLNVKIGYGTTVMAGSVINVDAQIGNHCIVNTSASIDHDCQIDDYVHICPGTFIAGNVNIGNQSLVGIGATIKNNVTLANDVIIGAGAVVVKDIYEKGTYMGIPARRT